MGRRLRRLRTAVGTSAVVMALAVTAACGGSSTSSSHSGLQAALAGVSGDRMSGPFAWADFARLRALGVITPASVPGGYRVDARWQLATGYGIADSNGALQLAQVLGVKLFAADTATSLGQPPNLGTVLTGHFDADRLRATFRSFGATSRTFGKTDGLSLAPDNQLDLSSKFGRATDDIFQSSYNQVAVSSVRLAHAANGASLRAVLEPGKTSLDQKGDYAALAGCLGDVTSAYLVASDDKQTTLVGVGVRHQDAASDPVHEVICAVPAAGRGAAVKQAFTTRLAPKAVDPSANVPVGDRIAATTVDTDGKLVRAVLTVKQDAPVGYLYAGMLRDTYRYWDGHCEAADLRTC